MMPNKQIPEYLVTEPELVYGRTLSELLFLCDGCANTRRERGDTLTQPNQNHGNFCDGVDGYCAHGNE
jgi:hypothetical protein